MRKMSRLLMYLLNWFACGLMTAIIQTQASKEKPFQSRNKEILSKFNSFFDARVDGLPMTFAELEVSPQWTRL